MSDQPIETSALPEIGVYTPPRRFWPVATFVILALNFIIFILMELSGGSKNSDVLVQFGAAYGPYLRRGEYWRLVMPMFLHIGWLHLLVNMYALYVLGPILERVYSYGRYTLLYVGTGIGSSFLSMRVSDIFRHTPPVAAGASGAIFGIAGVMLVTGYLHREVIPPRWGRAFGRGMLPMIVLNLIFGFLVPGIDNWGHLGGLATGILLALLIPPPGQPVAYAPAEDKPSQAIVLVPILTVVLAMAATVEHYRASSRLLPLLQAGERLHAAGKIDEAEAKFREAARLAPEDERPHEAMGFLELNQKHIPEAVREFQEALRLNPLSPRAQLGLAVAFERQGDPAKARQLFEGVLGKNPATPEGHQLLGDLCMEQKLYPEAIQHYQEALRLNPVLAVAHNNLAWLLATCEDTHFRDPQQALEHARRAVELTEGKEATFIDTLAEAQYANHNFAEAVKVQSRALELDPGNKEYNEHMARYRKAAGV